VTHPIETAAIGALVIVRMARAALVPVVALVLTLAGWRPSPAPIARDWAGRPFASLTVRELRLHARAAGYRALARSGRRADLLAALAA